MADAVLRAVLFSSLRLDSTQQVRGEHDSGCELDPTRVGGSRRGGWEVAGRQGPKERRRTDGQRQRRR
jgi:hypothetical protein